MVIIVYLQTSGLLSWARSLLKIIRTFIFTASNNLLRLESASAGKESVMRPDFWLDLAMAREADFDLVLRDLTPGLLRSFSRLSLGRELDQT